MGDVAERVKGIVVEHLGVDKEKVTESSSFINGCQNSRTRSAVRRADNSKSGWGSRQRWEMGRPTLHDR